MILNLNSAPYFGESQYKAVKAVLNALESRIPEIHTIAQPFPLTHLAALTPGFPGKI